MVYIYGNVLFSWSIISSEYHYMKLRHCFFRWPGYTYAKRKWTCAVWNRDCIWVKSMCVLRSPPARARQLRIISTSWVPDQWRIPYWWLTPTIKYFESNAIVFGQKYNKIEWVKDTIKLNDLWNKPLIVWNISSACLCHIS
jgi:hypothetical protein